MEFIKSCEFHYQHFAFELPAVCCIQLRCDQHLSIRFFLHSGDFKNKFMKCLRGRMLQLSVLEWIVVGVLIVDRQYHQRQLWPHHRLHRHIIFLRLLLVHIWAEPFLRKKKKRILRFIYFYSVKLLSFLFNDGKQHQQRKKKRINKLADAVTARSTCCAWEWKFGADTGRWINCGFYLFLLLRLYLCIAKATRMSEYLEPSTLTSLPSSFLLRIASEKDAFKSVPTIV